jgi:hypothetical protein
MEKITTEQFNILMMHKRMSGVTKAYKNDIYSILCNERKIEDVFPTSVARYAQSDINALLTFHKEIFAAYCPQPEVKIEKD